MIDKKSPEQALNAIIGEVRREAAKGETEEAEESVWSEIHRSSVPLGSLSALIALLFENGVLRGADLDRFRELQKKHITGLAAITGAIGSTAGFNISCSADGIDDIARKGGFEGAIDLVETAVNFMDDDMIHNPAAEQNTKVRQSLMALIQEFQKQQDRKKREASESE